MDRRKKRTSTNQYMMYINMMEKDPIFATGRIPRDVDVNYLHKKWKELSDKLNTCSTGPSLTADEWRKRLNDWKNTTRCKYRRSLSGEKDITLTSLEQKALDLFGKVPNTSGGEMSIHLKSEKCDDMEEDMDHQRTSDTLQKELQAAVEEAIGGEDHEDGLDDGHDDQDDMMADPLNTNTNTTLNTLNTVNTGSGGGGNGGSHNNSTTTYRTIVVENAQYTDDDNNDDHLELIPHRHRGGVSSSSVATGVQTMVTNSTTATKLINGELPVKRLRTQGNEQIIYEVKKAPQHVSRPMPAVLTATPIITAQPTVTAQAHYQQQDLSNGQATTYHLSGTNTSITASSSGTTSNTQDIARQLKRIADLKAEKLKFEIARFKFNNPGFEFTSPLL